MTFISVRLKRCLGIIVYFIAFSVSAETPPDEICQDYWSEPQFSGLKAVAQNVAVFRGQVCIGSCWLVQKEGQMICTPSPGHSFKVQTIKRG
ncbi:MAG TPA: hypothetical protein PK129_12685, partial [Cellvibrionaceae bacterium]|nr:hypothetical protein [Cellvibrionaceae bacterium]